MESNTSNRLYTPEEYLVLELAAEYKNEYYNGRILPMESHSGNQNLVTTGCQFAIDRALRQEDWLVYSSGFKIRINEPRTYFYPEFSVVRGKPNWEDNRYSYTNPTLIAEVLAEWSEAFDRGEKFHRYQLIPSFREYVLLSKDKVFVEVFFKLDDGGWRYDDYTGLDAVMELRSLGIQIKLADIYLRIEFE
jgi:Uma2 family endonuclease